MTDRDVMKMALNACEEFIEAYDLIGEQPATERAMLKANASLSALRSALAQPGQKPDMADAYVGAREDLSIWKRRALEAERDLCEAWKTISRLTAAINGPTHMGEPAIAQPDLMLNGLTEAQTSATASVAGLSQPEPKIGCIPDFVRLKPDSQKDETAGVVQLIESLLTLSKELDGELDSGANWSKAQNTCASVSAGLQEIIQALGGDAKRLAWKPLTDTQADRHDLLRLLLEERETTRRLANALRKEVETPIPNGNSKPAPEPQGEPVAWTDREIELIDGMIEVQMHHAAQCDRIANRMMAEKQKGWDMERVALLTRVRNAPPRPQRDPSDEEIDDIADNSEHVGEANISLRRLRLFAKEILAARKA